MSKTLIRPIAPRKPDWEFLPHEDGFTVVKVQVKPNELRNKAGVVLQLGNCHYKVMKFQRLPGKPPQPPLQPHKVWCIKTQ